MQLYSVETNVLVTHNHWRTKRGHKRRMVFYVMAESPDDAKIKVKQIILDLEDNPPPVFGSKQNTETKPLMVQRTLVEMTVKGPINFAIEQFTGVSYTG